MNARLDQILIRLGYANEEQIQQALRRQKTHGGRIGSHLLYFKFLTEQQLAEALSVQHEIPRFDAAVHRIDGELVARFPAKLAIENLVVPVSLDESRGELTAVVADPEDTRPLAALRRVFACSNVVRLVSPETAVRALISQLYTGEESKDGSGLVVELPDLFEAATAPTDGSEPAPKGEGADMDPGQVLMISRATFLRNFLSPIFERDGYSLHVTSDKTEIEDLLRKRTFRHILIAEEAENDFRDWLTSRRIALPEVEISGFTSVTEMLLANPAPYRTIVRSLLRALQIIAEVRGADSARTPPYDLICRDAEALGASLGLRRLAVDGLQIATLLLKPDLDRPEAVADPDKIAFKDFDKTLDYARSLRFPWAIDDVLRLFAGLLSGEVAAGKLEHPDVETATAAQALALVWYRHAASLAPREPREESTSRDKTRLREQSGRIAGSEIIEAYLRILDRMRDAPRPSQHQQLFLLGEFGSVADQFATRLKHAGYRLVRIDDFDEARAMARRLSPTAILVHDESYPDDILTCKARLSGETPVLFYAITGECNPSRVLDLFDAGFDDVFAPPYDFDIVAARIGKSIRSISTHTPALKPGGFRATLRAFAFIDLVQALEQSRKSVRISLEREDGERARIFMREGRIVHAVCGKRTGVNVIYDVIAWGEEGGFTVEPETRFPDDNLTESNEAILMEGCRLLDESKTRSPV